MPPDTMPEAPVRVVRSTCPYCGVGCGVLVETQGEGAARRIVGVRGDPEHPANHGRLCTKGSSLHLTAEPLRQRQARLDRPMLRPGRGAAHVALAWDEALDQAARRFADCIAEHGPDSVAFYVSGQLLTEDYYVFNKLAKGLVGTNNIDSNSRLCMSSAVAGYKASLGADAPPACYEDIEAAECVLVTGSNTAYAHPVLFARLQAARAARPGMRLVVVDPRRTDTAAAADLHLAIRPGTDVTLFLAMLHVAIVEDLLDHELIAAGTRGFDALRRQALGCPPAKAAIACGVEAAAIVQAARWFAGSRATLSLYCQGLNQSVSGTANNVALVNLHLATGQIGRPGAGPMSLTGQPNAMGGREVGALANLASAHRDLANPADRDEIARHWGVRDVPSRPGPAAVALFDAMAAGRVRMIWIACTDPVHSLPDADRVREALRRADFVVLQDAFSGTATGDFADLLLPATTWGEKSGTVTNSERRISRVRAALDPWGDARADWAIAAGFGRRLERALAVRGIERRVDAGASLFGWPDVEAVWNEHRDLTRGRDLDITGLSYEILERNGPQQWPMPAGARRGVARLYADRRFATTDGRARFHAVEGGAPAERTDAAFPFALLTGRLRDQWHGMSRTGLVGRLFGHEPEPVVEIAAADCDAHGWRDGDLVRITSRRGAQVLPLRRSGSLRAGTAFVGMHWGPAFLAGGAGINALTLPAIDPVSQQPELKHCAVRIAPARLPHRLVAFGWLEPARVVAARRALLEIARDLPFAASVPFGRESEGVLLRAASAQAFDAARIRAIEDAFGVADAPLVTLDEPCDGGRRHLLLSAGRLRFVLLAGADTESEPWLRELLAQRADAAALGSRLLLPGATPPLPIEPRGRNVCNCVGVSESAIRRALESASGGRAERIEAARGATGCGSQCGACLAEVGRLADDCLRRLAGDTVSPGAHAPA